MAAVKGQLEAVKLLIEKGALVDQPAHYGGTALSQASLTGHLISSFQLVPTSPDLKNSPPLSGAAQNGRLSVVKLLVKKGADIHQASYQGVTPSRGLNRPAFKGQNEVVDFLMSKGATFEGSGTTAKICKCCGATGAKMKCALCLTVYYCSPECQKKGWKEGGQNRNKIQCAALTEMRASYMEKAKKEIEEKMALFGRRL